MNIRIAFYKKSRTLFWGLIRFQQRRKWIPERYSRYSHVEIVFMYDEKFQGQYRMIDDIHWVDSIDNFGLSFSSSEVDGWCRFKAIDWKTEHWDFVDLNVSQSDYAKMLNFCRKQNGNRYWTIAIFFAQVLNFNKKRNGTWFCSEIVTRTLQEMWMLCSMNSLFTKPGELAEELERSGNIISY